MNEWMNEWMISLENVLANGAIIWWLGAIQMIIMMPSARLYNIVMS